VLDGELIVADADGRPQFDRVLQRLRASSPPLVRRLRRELPATYMIFDVLWHREDSMSLPYAERRGLLEQLHLSGPAWHTVDSLTGPGTSLALLAASRAHGLEGIVAKRTSSPYRPGRRSRAWLKVKNFTNGRFWVGGWLPGPAGIGALLLGTYEHQPNGVRSDPDRRLRFEGLVEAGLSRTDRLALAHQLAPLERTSSPFTPPPRAEQLRSRSNPDRSRPRRCGSSHCCRSTFSSWPARPMGACGTPPISSSATFGADAP
jgi:bifunctional non-homologous end joining protein LigD